MRLIPRRTARLAMPARLVLLAGGLVMWAVLGTPGVAQAQGIRYDNITLGARGLPIGGASVAVCTIAASTNTTPCSPLAPIYSDRGLTQPQANPTATSGLGNYGFFAAPGSYLLQIYGPGLTTQVYTVTLPCDPSSSTPCSNVAGFSTSGAISAGTLSVTGNISATGTITASNIPTNIAGKPMTTDAVQFVSPNGADSNDGLSWGTAVKDLYTAWQNLAAGGTTNNGRGGTIYVAALSACGGPTTGQGLWVIGPNDPNWNSGNSSLWPAGFVRQMPVIVIGVGETGWISSSSQPAVLLQGCGSTSANQASLWITGTNVPMTFENLNFSGGLVAFTTCASNQNNTGCTNSSGATALVFKNVQFNPNVSVGGPAAYLGPNTFWIWFDHCNFQGPYQNSGVQGTDANQGLVLNAGSSSGAQVGLVFVTNSEFQSGGIVMHAENGTNGGSLYANNVTSEDQSDGYALLTVYNFWRANVVASSLYVSDASAATEPAVVAKPAPGQGWAGTASDWTSHVVAFNVHGKAQDVEGPVTIIGEQYSNAATIYPSKYGQVGFAMGRVFGQVDDARRQFAFTSPRFAQTTDGTRTSLPSSWHIVAGITETNATGPDGSTNAGDFTTTNSGTQGVQFFNKSLSVSAGDYLIFGAWARSVGANGFAGGSPFSWAGSCSLNEISGLSGAATLNFGLDMPGDGQWEWASHVYKVASTGSCSVIWQGDIGSSNETQFFGPVTLWIPTGTISDNEAAEIAAHLVSYSTTCKAGAACGMPGHDLQVAQHLTQTAASQWAGTVTLSSGAGSFTFPAAFTSAPVCTATDTTAANPVKASTNTTALTLSGTSSDVIAFICVGNPN
jgi:hypothetical protein